MHKSELHSIYQAMQKKGIICQIFSDVIDFTELIENFAGMKVPDPPDGVICIGNTAYILEHFRISIYKHDERGDISERANNSRYDKFFKSHPECAEKIEKYEPALTNLLDSFQDSLNSHMNQYPEYVKAAHRLHSEKKDSEEKYTFIVVVEDISNAIIDNEGLGILDISEFVQAILDFPQIDGVITYTTSPRGDFVVAKDRKRMEHDIKEHRLKKIEYCELLMMFEYMSILLDANEKEKIRRELHSLGIINDQFLIDDDVTVDKHGGN